MVGPPRSMQIGEHKGALGTHSQYTLASVKSKKQIYLQMYKDRQ